MNNWIKIVLIILGLLLIRLIINLSKWIQVKKYLNEYRKYLRDPTYDFAKKRPQIVQLFKDAGISNFTISRIEPAGFGQLKTYNIDGFLNLTVTDGEIITLVTRSFHEAIGIYRHRTLQTINPIFWIEFIIKLPEYLMNYFGVNSENNFVKAIQIVYWIIGIIAALEKLNILKVSHLID